MDQAHQRLGVLSGELDQLKPCYFSRYKQLHCFLKNK